MRHEKDYTDAEVILGDQVVVIHHTNSSQPQVVNVLGADVDDAGQVQRLYLDQLVHEPTQDRLGEWRVWGAVSSILERIHALDAAPRMEAH